MSSIVSEAKKQSSLSATKKKKPQNIWGFFSLINHSNIKIPLVRNSFDTREREQGFMIKFDKRTIWVGPPHLHLYLEKIRGGIIFSNTRIQESILGHLHEFSHNHSKTEKKSDSVVKPPQPVQIVFRLCRCNYATMRTY